MKTQNNDAAIARLTEPKILSAIDAKRLALNEGEKWWHHHYLSITELVWARNLHDGYLIHVYTDDTKRDHLFSVTV